MVEDLLTPIELAELEFAVAQDPAAHPVLPGTDGVRKARWSRAGMGKRGGIRVIYYYAAGKEVVLLIAAYAKNVQENLTDEQKKNIRKVVHSFEESLAR